MALPTDPDAPWPPPSQKRYYAKFEEWAAWYAGEPDGLVSAAQSNPRWRFWRRVAGQQDMRARVHVPVASDLAAVSGSLLFGEPPRVRIPKGHDEDETAAADEAATQADDKTQHRLQEIMAMGGVHARLVEAAEVAAALGGVYLHPAWDTAVAKYPLLAVVHADAAVPTFKWGVLTEVIFHRVFDESGNIVKRHLERHYVDNGKAKVDHAVYVGGKAHLGKKESAAQLGFEATVTLPFDHLDVQYVPNVRPNRLWRNSHLGISDYSGSEDLLDGLDETYASWMRDIRLAKARIIVPEDFLDRKGEFNSESEVFTPLSLEPGASDAGTRNILANQFAIRFNEHRETAGDFVERIASNAGYSPQTFGLRIEGRAETGTALRIRERKTILTLRKKGSYWRPAIATVLEDMLTVDVEVFGTTLVVQRPIVQMADSIIDEPLELAQTVQAMHAAEAASLQTKVQTLHPDWNDEEVAEEVERIKDDTAAMAPPVPDAFGGPLAEEEEGEDGGKPAVPFSGKPAVVVAKPAAKPPFGR
jgi:hypothetical protein